VFKVDEFGIPFMFGRVLELTDEDRFEILQLFAESSEPASIHKRDGKWIQGTPACYLPENIND
jgi:hypothetical protein